MSTVDIVEKERITRLEVEVADLTELVRRLTTLAIGSAGAATELLTDPEDDR